MTTRSVRVAAPILAMLILSAGASLLHADVLTLKNGERREGIVSPAPAEPDFVMFQDSTGQVKIARDRIRENGIEKESDVVNWTKLGDQYYLRKRYDQALQAYQKAQALGPGGNADLANRVQKAQAAIASTSSSARLEAIAAIDALLDQAEKSIAAGDFEGAKDILYKKVADLNPSVKQTERITDLKKSLQKTWAKERYDKLAWEAAAAHFEEVLKLDPADQEAFNYLIEIWSKMPEKTDQVIQAYTARLQTNPDDKVTRKNLADKYYAKGEFVKAAEQYESLYASGDFRDSQVNANLVNALSVLYEQARAKQDFDTAIDYYKRLQSYSDQFGDKELRQMEFWREWLRSDPKDLDRRTSLTLWARNQGLNELALSKLNEMRSQYPDDARVTDILRLYADESLAKANTAWQEGRIEQALAFANQTRRDYGYFDDIKEQAAQLAGMANQEMVKRGRQLKDIAMTYKKQGDSYLAMGESSLAAMRSTQIDRTLRVVDDKQNAIDSFQMAIQYYDQALSLWPDMDPVDRQAISMNRRKATNYYGTLTRTTPLPLPDTGYSHGD